MKLGFEVNYPNDSTQLLFIGWQSEQEVLAYVKQHFPWWLVAEIEILALEPGLHIFECVVEDD